MQSFKDNKGRVWIVEINVTAVKRVLALVNVDLTDISDGKLYEKLSTDTIALCNVLFVLVKDQADKTGVTDEDFGRALAGDVLAQASDAVLEELESFFPGRRRELMKKARAKMKSAEARILDAAIAKMDDPELDRQIEKLLREAAISSPESAASTQDPSPSDN